MRTRHLFLWLPLYELFHHSVHIIKSLWMTSLQGCIGCFPLEKCEVNTRHSRRHWLQTQEPERLPENCWSGDGLTWFIWPLVKYFHAFRLHVKDLLAIKKNYVSLRVTLTQSLSRTPSFSHESIFSVKCFGWTLAGLLVYNWTMWLLIKQ